MRKGYIILLVVVAGLMIGCISAPQPPAPTPANTQPAQPGDSGKETELPAEMEFPGGASNPSLLGSMQGAKADAIRKGVIYIIGKSAEEANQDKLKSILYDSKNQNSYAELIENTRKDNVDNDYIYEGQYKVKLKAIESTLKAQGIIKGASTVATTDKPKEDAKDTVTAADVEIGDVEYAPPTEKEKQFVASYVKKMTYLVIFDEETGEDPFIMKAGIGSANEYLISQGMNTIDFEQVEKLKKDQQMLYEEETGESMSIIQWIAQKLNADIYIEISGATTGKSKIGGKYYGNVNLTAKAYDASTGDLVAQAAYNPPSDTVSTVSEEDARLKAMEATIYAKIMPRFVEQIKGKMENTLLAGLRYEVIIQNPPNDRVMTKFWKSAKRGIKSYKMLYQSESEVKYAVWIIGGIEELKEVFYDTSETVTELADMYAVIARGKSITFNSGL